MQTTIPRNCRTSFVLQQLRSDGPSTIMIFTGKSPLPSTPHADRLLSSAFVWLTFTTPNLSKDAQYTWLCSSLPLSKLMSGFPLSFCLNCVYSLFRGAGLSLWLQTLLVKNDVKHFLYFCFRTLHLTTSLQVSQISGLQYVIFNFFLFFYFFIHIFFARNQANYWKIHVFRAATKILMPFSQLLSTICRCSHQSGGFCACVFPTKQKLHTAQLWCADLFCFIKQMK